MQQINGQPSLPCLLQAVQSHGPSEAGFPLVLVSGWKSHCLQTMQAFQDHILSGSYASHPSCSGRDPMDIASVACYPALLHQNRTVSHIRTTHQMIKQNLYTIYPHMIWNTNQV